MKSLSYYLAPLLYVPLIIFIVIGMEYSKKEDKNSTQTLNNISGGKVL